MLRTPLTQDGAIGALRTKIEQVLKRPEMYVGEDVMHLHWLLVGYLDALSVVCSGYEGGFLVAVPKPDPTRPAAAARLALIDVAKRILAEVPAAQTPPQ